MSIIGESAFEKVSPEKSLELAFGRLVKDEYENGVDERRQVEDPNGEVVDLAHDNARMRVVVDVNRPHNNVWDLSENDAKREREKTPECL